MERLYLIDGMALAYRGFFAFIKSPLRNSKGQNVSAVYSFLVALRKLMDEERAERLVVVFDTDRATFRQALYPEYKAHRPPMPDELKAQIPLLLRLLSAMRVPVIQQAGLEADDIIGTLAVKMSKSGGRAFIVSKDKDFAQLINENIILIDPKMQGEKTLLTGATEVEEKFGLPPEKIVDYLALIGDASDNIPGVPKVGPKTAVELLREYGTLDAVYKNLDKIQKPALKKTLSENRGLADLSRTLVTLKTDLDIPLVPFTHGPVNDDDYIPFLKEMEFNQFLKTAGSARTASKEMPTAYAAADTEEAVAAFVRAALKKGVFAVDTETDGLESRTVALAGISLSCAEGEAIYLPIGHASGKNLPVDKARRLLSPLFESETVEKAGHNLKFDLAVLAHHGFPVRGPLFDTLIAAYVLAPGLRQYSLDACALEHFNIVMQPITELIGEKKKEQIPFSQVAIADAAQYSCADADLTLRLRHCYRKKLEEAGLFDLFRDIEMPLVRVLLAMEKEGIRIDRGALSELSVEYDKTLTDLHLKIIKLAGREFNLNSPKQLQEILFDELKIPTVRKLKTGFSTDADVLEILAVNHELPRLLLQHRKYTKLKSTYVDALPLAADASGCVHTSFNQTVTATGRLSSSNPNLQNIPVKTEEGREIRRAFVPRSRGNVLVSGDYSQIELRILAHVSGEEMLIEAFRNDEDIHRKTASLIFGTLPALVSDEERRMAKTVNFGIIYGQGAFGLSQQIGVSQKEARAFIDNYFATYPKIKAYMDDTIAYAREHGNVKTLFGRVRPLPEIHSSNRQVQAFAERMAVNTPIQGAAADLIKIAMVRLFNTIESGKVPAALLLQVHDELVLEAAEKDADKVMATLVHEMENAHAFTVPLKVDARIGKNWLEAHG